MAERAEPPGGVDQDDLDAPSAWFSSWDNEATQALPRASRRPRRDDRDSRRGRSTRSRTANQRPLPTRRPR